MLLRTFIFFDNRPPPVYLLPAQSDISAGGRRRGGVPLPMFTVTYPLILEHHCLSPQQSGECAGAECLHAVREDWGCPVLQSPEVGDHMCSHYPRLRLQLAPPYSLPYHTFSRLKYFVQNQGRGSRGSSKTHTCSVSVGRIHCCRCSLTPADRSESRGSPIQIHVCIVPQYTKAFHTI